MKSIVDFLKDRKLVILTGVSAGAGKTTMGSLLKQESGFYKLITTTTRLPREENGRMEEHGIDYYFVSVEEFQSMLDKDEFFEYKQVGDNYYGLTWNELSKIPERDTPFVVCDLQGVETYRISIPQKQLVIIFMDVPNELLESRMEKRGDVPEKIAHRLQIAQSERKVGIPEGAVVIKNIYDPEKVFRDTLLPCLYAALSDGVWDG